jgi:hypothetical protein
MVECVTALVNTFFEAFENFDGSRLNAKIPAKLVPPAKQKDRASYSAVGGVDGGVNGGVNGGVEQFKEATHPRPTSVPMSPNAFLEAESHPRYRPSSQSTVPAPAAVLSPVAFQLPPWIQQASLHVSQSSWGIWVPSDETDEDAQALLCTASIVCDVSFIAERAGPALVEFEGIEPVGVECTFTASDVRMGFAKAKLPGFLEIAPSRPFQAFLRAKTSSEALAEAEHEIEHAGGEQK